MKYLLAIIFILISINLIVADNLSIPKDYFNLELVPHYYRNNTEITVFYLDQSFDSINLEFNMSTNSSLSAIQIINYSSLLINQIHFYDYGSVFNTSKIIAYTDKMSIINYSQGDILNFTIELTASDVNGNIYYGIGNKSIKIGRIPLIKETENKSNNYLFYLIVIVLILAFFYFLGNKSHRRY
jgi:hypothetical protein